MTTNQHVIYLMLYLLFKSVFPIICCDTQTSFVLLDLKGPITIINLEISSMEVLIQMFPAENTVFNIVLI